MTKDHGPIPDSYWVEPGRLLAGEYPGSKTDEGARRKLHQLLSAGVTFFLDLTEEGEYGLKPYAPFLHESAIPPGRPAVHRRMPSRMAGPRRWKKWRASWTP